MGLFASLPMIITVDCAQEASDTAGGNAVTGYVLKSGEGEALYDGTWIIKASPNDGTQGVEMHWNSMSPGLSTGLHVHVQADEFFYVLGGSGVAVLNEQETRIEPGDVIFVPKGHDHKLVNVGEEPLELLFFLDKLGLANEARALYHRFQETGEPPTLEELNEIANEYGTIYKSLE